MKGKLIQRFIGLFEIIEKIGVVAYRFALPGRMGQIHDVFHVSMLRKYEPDPSHVIDWQPLQSEEDISYPIRPIQILDSKEKVLRNKVIHLVKVLWMHHNTEEATWEKEADMLAQYPDLFT